jgi:hypothetical protein
MIGIEVEESAAAAGADDDDFSSVHQQSVAMDKERMAETMQYGHD